MTTEEYQALLEQQERELQNDPEKRKEFEEFCRAVERQKKDPDPSEHGLYNSRRPISPEEEKWEEGLLKYIFGEKTPTKTESQEKNPAPEKTKVPTPIRRRRRAASE